MSYITAKSKAKKAFMMEFSKAIFNKEKAYINTNLWCEFCMEGKKRWEIKLVGADNADKVKDQWLRETLASPENDFIFGCEPCIKKLALQPLQNEQGGKWDGESEAIYEVIMMRNPFTK